MSDQQKSGRTGEIIRFAVAGGICFLIEFGILVLLKENLKTDTLIATPLAFLISVAVNYLLCVKWVFQKAGDAGMTAKAGFLITSLIGLALNELLMLLFRITLGEETVLFTVAGRNISMYMVNKALATLLVMIWNYFTKKAILTSEWTKKLSRRLGGKND